MALIAPALLAADLARLGDALRLIEAAGCRMVHIDVGDGHFTTDVTVGQPVVECIRKATRLELDLHFLIERPERYVAEFVQAGAGRIAVHPESTPHPYDALRLIRRLGAKVGLAVGLGTPLSSISELLGDLDFLNILTAEPEYDTASGCEERKLLPSQLDKVRQAFELRVQLGLRFEVQVEGGVTLLNIEDVARTGADILVSGSDIFHSQDPLARLTDVIRVASRFGASDPRESQSFAGGTSAVS